MRTMAFASSAASLPQRPACWQKRLRAGQAKEKRHFVQVRLDDEIRLTFTSIPLAGLCRANICGDLRCIERR
jgi:hypothetical protein